MKSLIASTAILVVGLLSLRLGVGTAQGPGVLNQQVTLVGVLEFVGTNYFTDPRFVLVDDQGTRISVTPWLPLEVPPSMPGAPAGPRPATMADFRGKRVSLTGIVRSGPPARPTPTGAAGTYIEVRRAVIVTAPTAGTNPIPAPPADAATARPAATAAAGSVSPGSTLPSPQPTRSAAAAASTAPAVNAVVVGGTARPVAVIPAGAPSAASNSSRPAQPVPSASPSPAAASPTSPPVAVGEAPPRRP
jgi:hypothetical protein